jgi:hypothetical protein
MIRDGWQVCMNEEMPKPVSCDITLLFPVDLSCEQYKYCFSQI